MEDQSSSLSSSRSLSACAMWSSIGPRCLPRSLEHTWHRIGLMAEKLHQDKGDRSKQVQNEPVGLCAPSALQEPFDDLKDSSGYWANFNGQGHPVSKLQYNLDSCSVDPKARSRWSPVEITCRSERAGILVFRATGRLSLARGLFSFAVKSRSVGDSVTSMDHGQ